MLHSANPLIQKTTCFLTNFLEPALTILYRIVLSLEATERVKLKSVLILVTFNGSSQDQ